MLRKPWPIIFLSLFFLIIPFFNIFLTYFSLKTSLGFNNYLYNLAYNSKNYSFLFDMTVPSLLSSIAIYNVKKWSYPVFLSSMIWITARATYLYSNQLQLSELILTILLPMLINILFVSYLLLPNLRAIYCDLKLQWWETKPRYLFLSDLIVVNNGNIIHGKVTNISEGGLFALISTPIESKSLVDLNFVILGAHFLLNATIVYCKADGISHGLQFINLTRDQKKSLKKLMKKLSKDKYEQTRPIPIWNEDLKGWFLTLIKTGKGIVPKIPKNNNLGQ